MEYCQAIQNEGKLRHSPGNLSLPHPLYDSRLVPARCQSGRSEWQRPRGEKARSEEEGALSAGKAGSQEASPATEAASSAESVGLLPVSEECSDKVFATAREGFPVWTPFSRCTTWSSLGTRCNSFGVSRSFGIVIPSRGVCFRISFAWSTRAASFAKRI